MLKEKQHDIDELDPIEEGVLTPDNGEPLNFNKAMERGVEGNFQRDLERELDEALAEQEGTISFDDLDFDELDDFLSQQGDDDGFHPGETS